MSWTSADLPLINNTADQFVGIITDGLNDERGVHLETAIGTAGCVAGVSILRYAVAIEGIDLSQLIKTKPGQPVLIEKVNEIGQAVSEFMRGFCKPLGIDPQSGWTMPIPEDHRPLREVVDLVRQFEKPFQDLMKQQGVMQDLHPFVAALAAMKLVKMGINMLDPDIGKAIALTATVAASKTVPYN